MKKSVFLMMLIAVFAFSSCSSISNAVSSDSAAKSMGTTCGTALSGLYKSYKAAGNKININDASILTNVIAVSTSTVGLKNNAKNAAYRKSYIAGLVAGSAGLLSETKAAAVYDKLVAVQGALSGVNSSTTGTPLSNAVNAIVAVLSVI